MSEINHIVYQLQYKRVFESQQVKTTERVVAFYFGYNFITNGRCNYFAVYMDLQFCIFYIGNC